MLYLARWTWNEPLNEPLEKVGHPLLPAHAKFGSVAGYVEAVFFFEAPHGLHVLEMDCSETLSSVGVEAV